MLHILLIDDEPIYSETLRRRGFDVEHVTRASEAMSRLKTGHEAIVCDLRLPEAAGSEVVGLVTQMAAPVPVYVWSGHFTGDETHPNWFGKDEAGTRALVAKLKGES